MDIKMYYTSMSNQQNWTESWRLDGSLSESIKVFNYCYFIPGQFLQVELDSWRWWRENTWCGWNSGELLTHWRWGPRTGLGFRRHRFFCWRSPHVQRRGHCNRNSRSSKWSRTARGQGQCWGKESLIQSSLWHPDAFLIEINKTG